jgi:hypothetical protein
MPVTKIRVHFARLDVLDDSDWLWGSGEWKLHANVDGHAVGNSSHQFTATVGTPIILSAGSWSRVVDVSGRGPGSNVQVRFRVIEDDVFSDDDLGEVTASIPYPYRNRLLEIPLDSPMLPGGWFHDDYRCYRLHLRVTIEEEFASTTTTGPQAIPVTRTASGGATFSTVKGTAFTPIVEICPVIPTPQFPVHMPTRAILPAVLAAGVPNHQNLATAPSAPNLNALPNPTVIPVLSATDPNLATLAARLEVTYYEPGNLDPNSFVWTVATGPAVIIGSNRGLSIRARGNPVASDTQVLFEIHWDSPSGPLLARYRAWVGKVGTLPYRVNILNGSTAALNTAGILSPATCHGIMQVAQAIFYQAGIRLVPDPTNTAFDGAALTPAGNTNATYVINLPAARNRHTRNVHTNAICRSTPYNFRPGVINVNIVHSTSGGFAVAMDRNGIGGVASAVTIFKGVRYYKWNGSGVKKPFKSDPSPSWIKPSCLLKATGSLQHTLVTIEPTDRVKQAGNMDKTFVKARNKASPPFTGAMMNQLYACIVPARWAPAGWTAAMLTWQQGVNISHEIGHILGLAHRGSASQNTVYPAKSLDGWDCVDQNGNTVGHPWNENVMTYGYFSMTPRNHDIDMVQASVIRTHPAIAYPP